MINANELRVGKTLIEVDGIKVIPTHLHQTHFTWLVGVTKDGTKVYNPYIPYQDERVKGIELTKEWLVKLGFEKRDTGYWYPKGCWHTYTFHQRLCFTNALNLEAKGYLIPHAQVYYVHQLQNLHFTLTGKELTINDK